MATTWADVAENPNKARTVRTVVGTATTGSETKPADNDETAGIALNGIRSLSVHAEAGSAFTAGGALDVYVMNPNSKKWNLRADLRQTFEAVAGQMFFIADVGTLVGRIAVVPSGAGVAAAYTLIGDYV